jgi:iron complex transport system substrate-binding protein
VEIAGGDYLFPEKASASLARDRVADPAEVARRDPEVVLASWCGKRVDLDAIARRPGWDATSAVREGRVHEVDPAVLLQPGPAVLTDGLDEVHERIAAAVR